MQIVNLKKYYYELFKKDTFVEVSAEVAEALLLMHREENNHKRKIWYHKAFYSLDREDGIENDALDFTDKSPERVFLLTLGRLEEALSSLTPVQEKRIRARYLCGMKVREIAAAEGVSISVVHTSIRSGIKNLKTYFEKRKWREFEE